MIQTCKECGREAVKCNMEGYCMACQELEKGYTNKHPDEKEKKKETKAKVNTEEVAKALKPTPLHPDLTGKNVRIGIDQEHEQPFIGKLRQLPPYCEGWAILEVEGGGVIKLNAAYITYVIEEIEEEG